MKRTIRIHRPALFAMLLLWVAALAGSHFAGASARAGNAEEDRIFELRVYTAAEGKLDELHARFRDHTCDLFEKHGMTLVGYWTPSKGDEAENTLIYVLAYPDQEARDASWKAFITDPDWVKVYAESRQNGPLVTNVESTMMSPTDYSPLK